jgi:CRP/FNR family transcriptional regulator
VKLVKTTPQGNDAIVGIISGACPLNPDVLYTDRPFLTSAVALEDTTCVLVPTGALVLLLEQHPGATTQLSRGLCESLDDSLMWITDLTRGRVKVRMAQLFLRLARTVGQPRHGATFIPLRLSRQELADSVGTTIETCIRLMSRWGKQRIVLTNPNGFLVSDPHTLELLAEADPAHAQSHDSQTAGRLTVGRTPSLNRQRRPRSEFPHHRVNIPARR